MKSRILPFLCVALLTLGGCQTSDWNWGTKQTAGGAAGAIAGGLAGSQIGSGSGQLWATGAGVLLGTFIGSEIGKSLDKADMAYHKQATRQAYEAPINETISWKNPDSGHYGSITPVREGETANGQYCREYQQTIVVDGQAETAKGVACKQNDGTWQLVN